MKSLKVFDLLGEIHDIWRQQWKGTHLMPNLFQRDLWNYIKAPN